MNQRAHLVACARQSIDVRFAHQGRGEDGLDCLGLLLVTAAHAGLVFEGMPAMQLEVPTYGLRPDIVQLKKRMDELLQPIVRDDLLPADVVLLKVNGSPQHLAMITDYPMRGELGMIHAYAPARKVVEHRYDTAWRAQTYATYRLPQLT
jgi:hypothetical protein